MSKIKRYEVTLAKLEHCTVLIDAPTEMDALKWAEFEVRIGNTKPVWKEGECYAKDVEECESDR